MLGKVIREARERRGLTQTQLAEAAEISVSYLSDVERGRRDMPASTRARVATGLGVGSELLDAASGALPERLAGLSAEQVERFRANVAAWCDTLQQIGEIWAQEGVTDDSSDQ